MIFNKPVKRTSSLSCYMLDVSNNRTCGDGDSRVASFEVTIENLPFRRNLFTIVLIVICVSVIAFMIAKKWYN